MPNKKVEEILKSIKTATADPPAAVVTKKPKEKKPKPIKPEVPRGKPKSGRVWKSQKQRFSSIKKTKGAHQTFAEKTALRIQLREIKKASKEIQEEKKAIKEANKERRRENLKRTEENRLKSEIVQVITNSAKIKRMRKKQLRFIEKRDTTKVSK